MKNIIFCVSKIFFLIAFLTGCEVGITPLDYGDTDPSVGVIVTEVSEVIDGENGGSILEVSNVPEQITLNDIEVELTGVGSENFETIVDLSNNIFTIIAKPIEGFSVREDTTFNLFATVYINGVSSCVKPIVITLKGTNTQPVATLLEVTLDEDTSIEITLLAQDADNDTLTYSLQSSVTHGSTVLSGNKVTYTPVENYFGEDSFTFSVNDGIVDSNVATVNIVVNNVNEVPVAYDNNISLYENTTRIIILRGQDDDGDPLQFAITQPANGTVVLDGDEVTYTPDANFIGTDSFTFVVNDGQIDSQPATVTVSVIPAIIVDVTAPVITANGLLTVSVEAGTIYMDAGATALDDKDGDITANIVTVNTVNTNIPNTYTVTYNVNDNAGNPASELSRTVIVQDTTSPIITLTGVNPQIIEAGEAYSELSATAIDLIDDNTVLTGSIVVNTSAVDTNVLGTYAVTYDVNDTAGNAAAQVSRSVIVQDTTKPVIILNGNAVVNVVLNGIYTDLGASASDSLEGDITASISTVNPVNVNQVGTYTITYNVQDTAGNTAVEVTRTVNVADISDPVITLLGSTPVDVEYGSSYTDAGTTAFDTEDGDITGSIVIGGDTVDINTLGTYSITYDVNDSASNTAIQVQRVVHVVDTVLPTITLSGAATVNVEAGTGYTDAGATATDNVDGDITASISTTNLVDSNVVGTYMVTYDVSDTSLNAAVQVTRMVIVEDTINPVIALNGAAEITLEIGSVYTELGATATDNMDGDISNDINIDSTSVDTSTFGTYTVRYNVADTEGNDADEVLRTVVVIRTGPLPYLFKWCEDATGEELWSSDGTIANTFLLKDISPGSISSNPEDLTEVNGILFLIADNGSDGKELWRTDGTTQSTIIVKDITVDGNGSASPTELTNVNGTLFFTADDKINGVELWKSDGTPSSTVMVEDIAADGSNSSPKELTNVDGTLFFTADDTISGVELWKSDGTSSGTVMVPGITMEIGTTSPYSLAEVNGTLFFAANDGTTSGSELWKTDGINTDMITAVDINISNPQYITNVNGLAYFSMYDDTYRTELWKSNGNVGDLELVRDIETGDKMEDSSWPQELTEVNGILYFTIFKKDGKKELWRTDEKDGAKKVGGSDSKEVIQNLTNVNGRLYYSDLDKDRKYRLWWVDDKGDAKKLMVFDPVDGLSEFRNVNGMLYFRVIKNDGRDELWTSESILADIPHPIATGCTP